MEYIFNSITNLKSEKNSIIKVEPILLSLKSEFSIQDENFYNIMIAVTEGINNAINHGNKLNPNKIVELEIHANLEEVFIIIKDEGDGFDPDSIDNCLDPENLLKSSGRGVFLIKELMDESQFNSSCVGTEIRMKYFLKKH